LTVNKCDIIAQEAWDMIITIARQCGSGGHEIGKELASRHVIDHKVKQEKMTE
jgi:hypothetical protein